MKFFGLISLLIVVGVVGWLVSKPGAETSQIEKNHIYSDALDSARTAADVLSGDAVEIYSGVSVAKDSKLVDLSGQGFHGSLKAEIHQLTQLETLNINNNHFTGLPAEVGQLTRLRVLNLSNNPFTGLPHELGNLSRLEILDLRGTNYANKDLDIIKMKLPPTTQILID